MGWLAGVGVVYAGDASGGSESHDAEDGIFGGDVAAAIIWLGKVNEELGSSIVGRLVTMVCSRAWILEVQPCDTRPSCCGAEVLR